VTEFDDGDVNEEFAQLAASLRQLADQGEGTVLGLVAAGRAGVRRVSRAAAEAFEGRLAQAYRERSTLLVRYAARKVNDHARAEDVVQRVFEKILRRHRVDRPEVRNLEAYLLTAVCNEINRELRSVISDRQTLSLEPTAPEPEAEPPSRRVDVSAEVADALALRAALAELPPREREAVVLRTQWQLSVAEAAEIMGLSSGAVKRYTADGLRRLRERLSDPDHRDDLVRRAATPTQ
jgi:RNA polymerase sigma-70 factor (ECF subfamily)